MLAACPPPACWSSAWSASLRPCTAISSVELLSWKADDWANASYALALVTRSEDSLASTLNTFALPALLLSGILLPMTFAPTWLRRLSDLNPLKHIVDGIREMFRGDFTLWPGLGGVGLTVALVVVGIAVGARVFQRESA